MLLDIRMRRWGITDRYIYTYASSDSTAALLPCAKALGNHTTTSTSWVGVYTEVDFSYGQHSNWGERSEPHTCGENGKLSIYLYIYIYIYGTCIFRIYILPYLCTMQYFHMSHAVAIYSEYIVASYVWESQSVLQWMDIERPQNCCFTLLCNSHDEITQALPYNFTMYCTYLQHVSPSPKLFRKTDDWQCQLNLKRIFDKSDFFSWDIISTLIIAITQPHQHPGWVFTQR